MIDIDKKMSFYSLLFKYLKVFQLFAHVDWKFAKSEDKTQLFLWVFNVAIKNSELYADIKFVEAVYKTAHQKIESLKFATNLLVTFFLGERF